MGNLRFAIKMLFEDIGQCIFYIVSMIFSVTIIFNIFNVMYNEDFAGKSNETRMVFSLIAAIILLVSLLFVAFANLYFIYGKSKELAISILSGRSVYMVGGILTFQNGLLGIIGTILGLIVGFLIMPLINKIAYMSVGEVANIRAFSSMGFILTISIIIIQFVMMLLIDMGYAYRREVIELMSEKKTMYKRDTRNFKIPNLFYIIVYFLPVLVLFIPGTEQDKSKLYIDAVFIALIGMIGIIRFVIPKLIMTIKKRRYLYEKTKLQSLSNLHYSLRKANYLVIILVVSVGLLIQIICKYKDEAQIKAITMGAYIVVILLMAITIIYKVLIESLNRKNSFKQLKLIGYRDKEIKIIIREEESYFYGIILSIPLFHIVIMLWTSINAGYIDIRTAFILVSIYLGVYLFSYAISLIGYRKVIFNYLGEEN